MSIFRYFFLFLAQKRTDISYVSSSKKNIKLQLGRCVYTTFQTRTMQSCCYLAPKQNYNELMWHFIHSNYFRKLIYFSFTIPHKVVFKDFACFLGTANLRNNSSLVSTIPITCQRFIVPNLNFRRLLRRL